MNRVIRNVSWPTPPAADLKVTEARQDVVYFCNVPNKIYMSFMNRVAVLCKQRCTFAK